MKIKCNTFVFRDVIQEHSITTDSPISEIKKGEVIGFSNDEVNTEDILSLKRGKCFEKLNEEHVEKLKKEGKLCITVTEEVTYYFRILDNA